MVKKNETVPGRASEVLPLRKLIEAGQYDQIAEFLKARILTSSQVYDQAMMDVLATAQLTCWACRQCQVEIERHRQAVEEAAKRKDELSQQLYAMLVYIGGDTIFDVNPEQRPLAVSTLVNKPKTLNRTHASLSVYCLGTFRVYLNDQLITDWSSLKARSIFKYLVAHQGTPIAKDILMDVFWPEPEPEAARRNLHQAIYSLRQTLKQSDCLTCLPIQFENDCYLLNPELDIWMDYVEFETHLRNGRRHDSAGHSGEAELEYKIAEELYQGDFLEEEIYEDWPVSQRTYLQTVYLELVDRLSQSYMQQGKYAAAIKLCRKLLAQDGCHEEMHRRLMECYLAQGQRSLAIRQYQACVRFLKTELNAHPSPETQRLYKQIIEDSRTLVLAGLEMAAL